MNTRFFGTLMMTFFVGLFAFAQTSSTERMTFEGNLTDSLGNPIDFTIDGQEEITFYITNGTNCYLYGETTSTAGDAQGNIIHRIGSGIKVSGSPNNYSEKILNDPASGATIANNSACDVNRDEPRMVHVYYASQNISATFELGAVPYALVAKTLGGKESDAFVQKTNLPNCSAGTALQYNGSNFSCVSVAAGGVTSSAIESALGYIPVSRNGDVISGNLELSGSVRIGNNSNSCASSLAGALRFNSGNLQFCDGGGVWSLINSIAANSVGANEIINASITGDDIANTTIGYDKLNLVDDDIPQAKINGLTSSINSLTTGISGKENSITGGTNTQYWRGDKSWQTLDTTAVPEGTNLYHTDARVLSTGLTTFATSTTPITVGDSVLNAFAKLQGQIDARWGNNAGNLFYQNGNISIGTNAGSPHRLYTTSNANNFDAVAVFEQTGNTSVTEVTPLLSLSRRAPSGVSATNGFGSSLTFSADNASGSVTPQAAILTRWVNANGASETSQIEFVTSSLNVSGSSIFTTKMVLMPYGDLQVTGRINAGGSVRFGGDGDPNLYSCTGQEGKQRYNSVAKTMEFCNGQIWQGLNGVTNCPSVVGRDFALVGVSGTATAFCIDKSVQKDSARDYYGASADCRNLNTYGRSQGRVCGIRELEIACENYSALGGDSAFSSFKATAAASAVWTYTPGSAVGNNRRMRFMTTAPNNCHIGDRIFDDSTPMTTVDIGYRCCYQ